MTPEQRLALYGGALALIGALLLVGSAAITLAARAIRHARVAFRLVGDHIEMARLRHAIRAAVRNPFDDLAARAADADRSLTANCASDDDQPAVDTQPGSDHQALAELNRIYNAPSWEGK